MEKLERIALTIWIAVTLILAGLTTWFAINYTLEKNENLELKYDILTYIVMDENKVKVHLYDILTMREIDVITCQSAILKNQELVYDGKIMKLNHNTAVCMEVLNYE